MELMKIEELSTAIQLDKSLMTKPWKNCGNLVLSCMLL